MDVFFKIGATFWSWITVCRACMVRRVREWRLCHFPCTKKIHTTHFRSHIRRSFKFLQCTANGRSPQTHITVHTWRYKTIIWYFFISVILFFSFLQKWNYWNRLISLIEGNPVHLVLETRSFGHFASACGQHMHTLVQNERDSQMLIYQNVNIRGDMTVWR